MPPSGSPCAGSYIQSHIVHLHVSIYALLMADIQ
jgi:hypothetical protein